jgi:predicted DNA-binding ribbon-helix-helix protein
MKSCVVSHSINLDGHLTSISLEDDFWRSLKDIAASQQLSIRDLVSKIDSERKQGSLSSAVRLFVHRNRKQLFDYLVRVASNFSVIVRPSAFAVLRLMTNSYLVRACTGRSAGFSRGF